MSERIPLSPQEFDPPSPGGAPVADSPPPPPPLTGALINQFPRITHKIEDRNPGDHHVVMMLKSPDLMVVATAQVFAITLVYICEVPVQGVIGVARKLTNSLRDMP